MERRARDNFNQLYEDAAKHDYVSRQKADFDTRTAAQYQSREIRRRALKHKNEAEAALDARRSRLGSLLQSEESSFSREIEASFETPAQRRVRLQQRLAAIQAKQQQEHEEEVQRRLYNRWVEECDPLRPKISLAFERQVAKDREQQVIERDVARMQDDEEDEKYVKSVYDGVREYRERQQQEESDRRRKQNQNRNVWTADMNRHRDNVIRERDLVAEEGLRFRRQNDQDIIQAQKDAEQRRQAQYERRCELDAINRDQRQYRTRSAEEERALDLKYLQDAKDDLRREQEESLVARLIAKRKANANREQLEAQMSRQRESEEEAELYIQQAQEEANRKQDEQWRIDAEKRRRLMLDANQYQVRQMQERDEVRERRQLSKADERREAEEQRERGRQRDREEAEQRAMMIRNQHQMLDSQLAVRRENAARQKKEEQDSVKALLGGWAEEERKIEEAMRHPENFVGKRWRGHR
jgi:hypothetical protein